MTKSIFYFVCGILSFMTAIGIITGSVQKTIYFADPINEMIMCVFLFMLTFLFFAMTIPTKIKN